MRYWSRLPPSTSILPNTWFHASFPFWASCSILSLPNSFTYKATVVNGNLQENVTEQTTDHAEAIIGFQTHKGEQVHARIASSFISFEQAALNMKELGKDNIEQLAKKGKEAWKSNERYKQE